jgi:Putative restriction endonuclease
MESDAAEKHARGMSGSEYRAFQATRPDNERWELVGGVPMMIARPTLTHNLIATNLQMLLDEALEQHAPSMLAVQRPGLEVATSDHKPEPDVAVIDANFGAGQRFVEKAYLLAEVISGRDDLPVPGTDRMWVDVKRDLYRAHEHCRAVMIISQDIMEVRLDLKTDSGWESSLLRDGRAETVIPAFGFSCVVADLYHRTPLRRHRP